MMTSVRIVANAKDPKHVIHQVRCYIDTLTNPVTFDFRYILERLAKGRKYFNKVVRELRSTEQVATQEQAVGTTSKLGAFGNSNNALQCGQMSTMHKCRHLLRLF